MQEPEEVVRAFLEAEAHFRPSARFVGQRLRKMFEAADGWNIALGVTTEQAVANVRRLEVVELSESRALLHLDAFCVAHGKTLRGTLTTDHRIGGPIELHRHGDTWLIDRVTLDRIPLPDGFYEPIFAEQRGPAEIVIGAQLLKAGSMVIAQVTNRSNQPVVVDDLRVRVPCWRVLSMDWGSARTHIELGPGERWTGGVPWAKLSARAAVEARLFVDGTETAVKLSPPSKVGPLRRRLQPWLGYESFFYLLLVLASASSLATGTIGLLGVALAIPGCLTLARGTIFFLGGFSSSGAWAYVLIGGTELAVGSAIMIHVGFGWIATLIVVGSIGFGMHAAFANARSLRASRRAPTRG